MKQKLAALDDGEDGAESKGEGGEQNVRPGSSACACARESGGDGSTSLSRAEWYQH
jgi:hypothetical protein